MPLHVSRPLLASPLHCSYRPSNHSLTARRVGGLRHQCHAAVDSVRRTGDIGRFGRDQEPHHNGNLRGQAEPADRNTRMWHRLGCHPFGASHPGCDRTRRHAVDGDPVRRQFQREAFDQTTEPVLCGCVAEGVT